MQFQLTFEPRLPLRGSSLLAPQRSLGHIDCLALGESPSVVLLSAKRKDLPRVPAGISSFRVFVYGWYLDLRTETSLRVSDGNGTGNMLSFSLKEIMISHAKHNLQISYGAPVSPSLPLPDRRNATPVSTPGGDRNFTSFLRRTSALAFTIFTRLHNDLSLPFTFRAGLTIWKNICCIDTCPVPLHISQVTGLEPCSYRCRHMYCSVLCEEC